MRLSYPRLTSYALGAFGTGVFSTVPTVLLLYFCTETLAIAPARAALVVFLPKLWAIAWDPAVGVWSDKTRSRFGRRRPFLLVGGIGVALAFLTLFGWPYPTGAAAFPQVAIIYFVLANTYSLFAVPFIAVTAEISDATAERERVVTWRIGFGMIGVLIGAGLAPILVQAGGGGRQGYLFMALIIASICGVGMLSAFLATPSTTRHDEPRTSPLRAVLPIILRHRSFQKLATAYVLQLTGVGLLAAITPYWIVDVAARPASEVGVALGLMLLVTILATPIWASLIRRLGPDTVIAIAAGLYGCVTLGFLVLQPASHLATLSLFAAVGFPFCGLQVGPFALAAHLIHEVARSGRVPCEGVFTGLWTASEKLGLALGPGAAGLGLGIVGFTSGATAQTTGTLHGLTLLIALGPTLFLWLSLLPLLTPSRPLVEADT